MDDNIAIGIVLNSIIELGTFLISIKIKERSIILRKTSIEFINIIIQFVKLVFVIISVIFLIRDERIGLLFIIVSLVISIIFIFWYSKKLNDCPSELHAYNGVFAASAIIMTLDNKFLLVKRKNEKNPEFEGQEIWVQPGTFIRTNKLKRFGLIEKAPELPTLYKYLIDAMIDQAGLHPHEYKFLTLGGLTSIIEDKPIFVGDEDPDRENQFTPAPFMIQKEASLNKRKSSDTTVHMDCFFAFRLLNELNENTLSQLLENAKSNECKYSEIKPFDKETIDKMADNNECYKDLKIIVDNFLKLWRKSKYYSINKKCIRHCTFNNDKTILWLRINHDCNLQCNFCLLTDDKKNKNNIIADMSEKQIKNLENIINDNISKISIRNDIKLVMTGGEPFLIKNLSEIIKLIIDKCTTISTITICTNGTLWEDHQDSILILFEDIKNKENKKLNFVLNMPSWNEDLHKNLTGVDRCFNKKERFIAWLNEKGIQFTINVVLSKKFKFQMKNFISYWRKMEIKNVALTYAIRQGMISKNEIGEENICLNKNECIDLYGNLCSGEYNIEFLDTLELIIPSCDGVQCHENNNILAIESRNDNFIFIEGCLDQGI